MNRKRNNKRAPAANGKGATEITDSNGDLPQNPLECNHVPDPTLIEAAEIVRRAQLFCDFLRRHGQSSTLESALGAVGEQIAPPVGCRARCVNPGAVLFAKRRGWIIRDGEAIASGPQAHGGLIRRWQASSPHGQDRRAAE